MHMRAHAAMLRVGWRRRDHREVIGQLSRIAAAALASRIWIPEGNTGGANHETSPALPIGVVTDYTDALPKAFSYERLRPTLLRCTNDGLERLSEKRQRGQSVTESKNCLSPFCLQASPIFRSCRSPFGGLTGAKHCVPVFMLRAPGQMMGAERLSRPGFVKQCRELLQAIQQCG